MTRRPKRYPSLFIALTALAFVACDPGDPPPDNVGLVQLAAGSGETFDVAKFEMKIFPAGADCSDSMPVATAVVDLENDPAPAWLPEIEGHAFSGQSFVLEAGDYLVCVAPLQADDSPSALCAIASVDPVTVAAGDTTEVVLVSACNGAGTGGLDVIAALGEPPTIESLDVAPSKFITVCETATLTAAASDTDGMPVSDITFAVTDAPLGATPSVTGTNPATFDAITAGRYELTVTAIDATGSEATLVFPIHVQDDTCP